MAETVFVEAINQATAEEMRRDEAVFIMGEDIRRAVYGSTANLLSEFGTRILLNNLCNTRSSTKANGEILYLPEAFFD